MIAEQRLDSLRAKHANLKQEIDEEHNRPSPDDNRLFQLKREKLRIKDRIFAMEG